MRTWRTILTILSVATLGGFQAVADKAKEVKKVKVAITQYLSHAALDAVRQGVEKKVRTCLEKTHTIKFSISNASGNLSVARQIAQKHASENPTVIVAISTISAQTILSAVRGKIPVVFAAITDPKTAKLLGKNMTGVTDKPPFDEQIKFVKELLPKLRKLAILYNPGEDNSRAAVNELRSVTEKQNIELIEYAVSKATEISQTVAKVVQEADAIFIANDNLIASSFEPLIRVARIKGLPVFASDIMLVERGAIGMRGINYYSIGAQAGEQVCRILKGTSPEKIPVANPNDLKLYLNLDSAKAVGIVFPEALIKKADKIISTERDS